MELETIDHNNAEPYYLQVIKAIKDEIRKGNFKPNEKIYTQKELCARFKVSNITINKAMDELVREGLLYRRRAKGTFVAEKKEQEKSFVIGLVINNIANPFFARLAKVIQNRALEAKYNVVYYANSNLIEESRSIEMLIKGRANGVVLVPSLDSGEGNLIVGLEARGIPLVYLNRFLKKPESDYVIVNNIDGTTQNLKYLLSLGHRRIGFVAAAPYSRAIEERLEGYRVFVKKHHLHENVPIQISGFLNEEGGYDGGRIIFSSPNRPTAIFCANDITAVGLLKAARRFQIKVPDELSVIGFDDIEVAKHLSPPLTTVSQPLERMAEIAVEILMEKMKGNPRKRKEIVLAPKLVIRESCKRPEE